MTSPRRKKWLFDPEKAYNVCQTYRSMSRTEPKLINEAYDDLLNFIQSEIERNVLECVRKIIRPEIVQENDKTLISVNSRSFQDGVSWARKMIQEKIDAALREFEDE